MKKFEETRISTIKPSNSSLSTILPQWDSSYVYQLFRNYGPTLSYKVVPPSYKLVYKPHELVRYIMLYLP